MAQDWTRTNGWGGVGSFSIFSLLTLLSPSHHYANTKVANSPLTPLFFRSAPGQSQFFSTGREVIQDCQPISIKLKQPKSVGRRLSIFFFLDFQFGSDQSPRSWCWPKGNWTEEKRLRLTITEHAHINVLSSSGCEFMICENRTKWTQRKKSSRYACGSSYKHLY